MRRTARGSVSVEAVLLLPALMALLSLIALAGWIPASSVNLRHAVNAAARSGSQVSPAKSLGIAEMVLRRSLKDFDIRCARLESSVSLRADGGRRGVRVWARCQLSLTGLVLPNIGTKSVDATSFEVFDTYIFKGDD
jgi:hypothetical protein